jgi:SNF2 family DNA or RNA helicase
MTLAPPAPRKLLTKINDDVVFYAHQTEAVRQMAKMSGALLADEPGLGKTLQAMTVAAIAFELGEMTKFLVVCPTTLKENWADEFDTYSTFTYWILPNKMSKERRQRFILDFKASNIDCLLVNYEQVVSHLEDLNRVGFGMAIYDEAHAIKGHKSARSKACRELQIPRNFPLTGSPMLNQVNDLWALLHRVNPHEWPSYWTFVNRYAVMGGYMDKQIVGIKNERELRGRIKGTMIRRTKKDCLDLPEKQLIPVKLELHDEQRVAYKQAKEELRVDIGDSDNPFEIANQMVKALRLKQICGTLATLPGMPDVSSKLDYAVEMIKDFANGGHSCVVFTQFRMVMSCLVARLEEAGVPAWQLHGDVPATERRATVNDWTRHTERGNPGAMACMYQVGGVGLTMNAASRVILLDKLYSPKMNEQAIDRLHRIGQREIVQIFDLIAARSYESKIEQIIKQKETIFGAVMDYEASDWKRKLIELAKEDDGD